MIWLAFMPEGSPVGRVGVSAKSLYEPLVATVASVGLLRMADEPLVADQSACTDVLVPPPAAEMVKTPLLSESVTFVPARSPFTATVGIAGRSVRSLYEPLKRVGLPVRSAYAPEKIVGLSVRSL